MSDEVKLDEERRDRYLGKVEKIQVRISNIEEWIGQLSESEFERDEKSRLAVYEAFQEMAEAVADICAMYASDSGIVVGDNYENIEKASGDIYREELVDDLKSANGLRNRVVHEYNGVTHKVAFDSIKDFLPSIRRFAKEVRDWIKSR